MEPSRPLRLCPLRKYLDPRSDVLHVLDDRGKLLRSGDPSAGPMGTIGVPPLLTNIACLIVLRERCLRISRARVRLFEVMQSRSSLLHCRHGSPGAMWPDALAGLGMNADGRSTLGSLRGHRPQHELKRSDRRPELFVDAWDELRFTMPCGYTAAR